MQTLFGEEEEKPNTSLKIQAKGNKRLSKDQQRFNTLVVRIETLERQIAESKKKFDNLLEFYGKELVPVRKQVAEFQFKIAESLGKAAENFKFSKIQKEDVGGAIKYLFEEAFLFIEPSPEQEALYDKWSDASYQDEIDFQMDQAIDAIREALSELGIDIDLKDIDSTPEGFAKLQDRLKSAKEEYDKTKSRKKRTSGKKLELDQMRIAENEAQTKSIRSIYIALAKLLHPDAEPDPALKSEKEEIMKKVTVAYDQKDISTLLKLEMQWVHRENRNIEQITEEKLKIYISALKQQAAELEFEKQSVSGHPRYQLVAQYCYMNEQTAKLEISKEVKVRKDLIGEMKRTLTRLKMLTTKNDVAMFAKNICQSFEYDLPF